MANKCNIQRPFNDKWPCEVINENLLGECIYYWSLLDIKLAWNNESNSYEWTLDNKNFGLKLLTVKTQYLLLSGPLSHQIVEDNLKNKWIRNTIIWKKRWLHLDNIYYLLPKEKEFKYRLWLGKLWCSMNRVSFQYPDGFCPFCGMSELTERNHFLSLNCKKIKHFWKYFKATWFYWTTEKCKKNIWRYPPLPVI